MKKHFSRTLAMTGLLVLAPAMAMAMGGRPKDGDDEATNVRIQPVAKIKLAGSQAGSSAAAGARSGEELYNAICGACHEAGVAGAPKTGDKAAWAPRIGVGLDVLTKTSKAGKGAMPPKGGSDATDEELARAIIFMTNKSGANFKEPAAGTKSIASDKNPEEIAKATCFKCHETGDQGAPKLSDKAAWRQRGSKGLDAVTKTVIRGHGNMPARGGLADLTDEELKKVITVLLKEVGAE
ncbi:MAG: c-type cytochrome [Rhodocyclaceae bacterium]|nr:c-type cytochrome [Rhodocyclaceae bacterium]MDZ4216259.1 c-type cytochrome [Rhodocyclaceae bacterium]